MDLGAFRETFSEGHREVEVATEAVVVEAAVASAGWPPSSTGTARPSQPASADEPPPSP